MTKPEINLIKTTEVDIEMATPAMKKFLEIKKEHSDALLMYRMGDFYETFFEDAVLISKELEITKNLVPFFRIVPILFVKKYEDIFIHLYNYIDAHHLDGYAFLRNNQISYAIKKRSLYSYLSALKYQINKHTRNGADKIKSRNDCNILSEISVDSEKHHESETCAG